jgi:serine phosphatase RsbU (regulator of sigma subunit)
VLPGHSLSRRFSATFIGVVACILLAFATLAIVVNLSQLKTALHARLDHTVQLAQSSLSTPLWTLDYKVVENFLTALLLDPALVYVDVVWEGKVLAQQTRPPGRSAEFGFFARSRQFVVQTADIQYEGQPVGTIRLAVSRDSLRQALWRTIGGILTLTGLLIGAIFLTSISLTRRYIARPLATLQHSATLIAHGDLDAAIVTSSRDEIGRLGEDLQVMREALKASMGALRESNTQLAEYSRTLEQRVGERTAQLAQANAEITALNTRLQADNVRMGAELEVTRKLQQMLLPTAQELQAIQDLDIACYMEPADEVGGDYYDILSYNGQIKIGIGDVTGHGLESGVIMVMTQAIVRALLTNGETDPVRFLDTLNRTLYGNAQRMGTDKNLTLALLDYVAGEVRLSGQHEEMIVIRRDGDVELVDTSDLGFPIGLADEIAPFIAYTTVTLQPGDGVVLYTDGITEAENTLGELYGLERLCAVVSTHWGQTAATITAAVVADVRQHIGTHVVYDDVTLVVVKRPAADRLTLPAAALHQEESVL